MGSVSAQMPNISESSRSLLSLGFTGLLRNEVEFHLAGIHGDVLSCLEGRLPSDHLATTTDFLDHVCATALANWPPVSLSHWLGDVLNSLEKLLTSLLAALDEPCEADPELLAPALHLEEVAETRLDGVRRRRARLCHDGQVTTVESSSEGMERSETNVSTNRNSTEVVDGDGTSHRVLHGTPDGSPEGETNTESDGPPSATPHSPGVPDARSCRRSAGRVVRAALESRLQLLEAGRLKLDPDPPPPPPHPPAGWAVRLGARWPRIYRLAVQWAMEGLKNGRTMEADTVLSATGLRPSDALRFELLTTTNGSTRRLLADRLRQLQLLRGRDELLLRLLQLAGGARQSPATEQISTGRPRRPDLDQLLSGPSPPTLGQLLQMAPPTRRQLIVHMALNTDDIEMVRAAAARPAEVWRYLVAAGSLLWLRAWLDAAGVGREERRDGAEDGRNAPKEREAVKEGSDRTEDGRAEGRGKNSREKEASTKKEMTKMEGGGAKTDHTRDVKENRRDKIRDKSEYTRSATENRREKTKDGKVKTEDASDAIENRRSDQTNDDTSEEVESQLPGTDPESRAAAEDPTPLLGPAAGYGPASRPPPPGWIRALKVATDVADITEECGGRIRELVLDELARRGRYSAASLSSPHLLCRRVLRAGLLSGVSPPPTVRRAGLRLLASAAERPSSLQPALLGWLRQLPASRDELRQLPVELRRPGAPLDRVAALLAVEGFESDPKTAPRDGGRIDRGRALAALLEAEAAYQAGRVGESVSEYLSSRPWYRLGAALAAGRPLPPLMDLLWSTGEGTTIWPELRRVLVVENAAEEAKGATETAEPLNPTAGPSSSTAETADTPASGSEAAETSSLNTETNEKSLSAVVISETSESDVQREETAEPADETAKSAPETAAMPRRSCEIPETTEPTFDAAEKSEQIAEDVETLGTADGPTETGEHSRENVEPLSSCTAKSAENPTAEDAEAPSPAGETAETPNSGAEAAGPSDSTDESPSLSELLPGRCPDRLVGLLRSLQDTRTDGTSCSVDSSPDPIRDSSDGTETAFPVRPPTYRGYLRQARPLFAVCHLLNGGEVVGRRDSASTRLACDWAAELALRQSCDSCSCDSCHTSDSCDSRQLLGSAGCDDCRQRRAVVTGCVVFQHLLGHDVALLRAQLTAVRDVPQPLRAELVRGLLLGDTKAAATLLAHHEQRVMAALLAADTDTTTCDTAARWQQRATEFCQWRHALTLAVKLHLPFPERYLARLAARDEWLAFLLFAQIYQYPRDQVLRLSAGFSQSSLRQTLGCALRCLLLTRPAGKSSRRRVTSDTEHEWSTASPETSVSSSPPGGAGGPPTLALTAVPPPRDALPQSMVAAVVEAAADPCPGRALLQAARQMALPALAALATECEDVSAGDCLCGWLETSLSALTPAEEAACVRLKRLALLAVRTRRLRSLDKALAVFFPDCALRLTIQLLESLMTLEEPHLPAELMLNMMEALRNTTKQQDSELFIYDRHWLSITVLSLLLSSLSTLLTSAGRARLLGLMIDARLVEMLVTEQAERPDLPLLLRLSTVLGPSAVRLDWLTALPPGGGAEQLRLEASRAVAALCTAGELERADRLALAAGVSPDPVVLTQVTSDLGEVADEDRVTFWRQCSGRFTEKQLSRTEAVAFFRKHAETAVNVSERYVCLKLAWDWLSPDRRADPDCDITALERGVWTAYTWARINGEMVEEPEPSPTPIPTHQPLLYRRPLLASGRRPVQPALTPDQLTTVRAVLGQLVDEGHLRQALLVAEYFGATTPDLERMVRLLKLAERVGRHEEDEVSLESVGGEPTTASAATAAASAAVAAANSTTTTAASAVSSSQPAVCPKVGEDSIATTEAGATARDGLDSAAVSTEITEAAAAAGMDDRQHNSSEMDPNNSQTALGDSRLESETRPDVRLEGLATTGSSGTGQSRETTPESGGGWAGTGASSIHSETLATDADSVQPDPPSVHPDPSVDNKLGDNNEDRREEDGRRRSIGFCSSLGRSWKHSLFCSTADARQPQSPSELSQLTELVAALRHGSEIGQRVLSCARAATDLQTTYQEVVLTREPLLLLSSVLTGDPAGVDRYRLAADLIHGLQLPDSQVTEVILAQVIAQVKAGVSELDPLLALCPDPVLLGNRLLDTAEDLASFPEADGYGDDCQVGLLVAAHSAHTARLNLQGIGDVMGRARQLVRRLLVKEDFRLMVSLLLGLGRYEEMAYVFELLLREDRLERLLTAGVSDGRLGAALRRHLIRHHPEDTARLRLVTGRFGHHAEAAADWQSRAEQLITSVLQSGPDEHCTESGQLRLREAMDCYRHAATFYRHAERLSSADASLCQAQLVALQISISSGTLPLPEGVRPLLLRRSHQQLHTLLTETLPYRAARLVLRAYPERPADWSQLLYRQYLCLGRDEYLTEYLQTEGQLDHSVIAGILKRIRGSARQFSPSRLRRLTLAAAGPELQYRAASQLQLRDVIGALLDTAEAGWLRDTVWKTGGM